MALKLPPWQSRLCLALASTLTLDASLAYFRAKGVPHEYGCRLRGVADLAGRGVQHRDRAAPGTYSGHEQLLAGAADRCAGCDLGAHHDRRRRPDADRRGAAERARP